MEQTLPTFREFQESKGIIVEESGFYEYPKCYKTIDTELSECLMFEDLKARDFKMIDRHTEAITGDHVRLVMQALGKFHAISYALKDQQPEKFKEITSNLDEWLFSRRDKKFEDYIDMMTQSVYDSVAGDEYTHLTDKLKNLYKISQFEVSMQCVDGKNEPSAVLCHG